MKSLLIFQALLFLKHQFNHLINKLYHKNYTGLLHNFTVLSSIFIKNVCMSNMQFKMIHHYEVTELVANNAAFIKIPNSKGKTMSLCVIFATILHTTSMQCIQLLNLGQQFSSWCAVDSCMLFIPKHYEVTQYLFSPFTLYVEHAKEIQNKKEMKNEKKCACLVNRIWLQNKLRPFNMGKKPN